jgi:hypothetical protein
MRSPRTMDVVGESLDLQRVGEADVGTRTRDPLLTMEVLYQLSYVGATPNPSVIGADRGIRQRRLRSVLLAVRSGHRKSAFGCRVCSHEICSPPQAAWLDSSGRGT